MKIEKKKTIFKIFIYTWKCSNYFFPFSLADLPIMDPYILMTALKILFQKKRWMNKKNANIHW